jgi:hypothetical protein
MSGALKSGLLFALVGLVCVIAFSFIPIGGPLWGVPVAAVLGASAGYFGVRWSAENASIGKGMLAGAIAGVGALIGSVIGWLVAISRVQSIPGFQELMQEQMRRQQPDAQFSSDQINMIIAITGPVLGLCLGIFSLLLSLGLGALGGWLAARRPTRQPAPPMGPPPLDPPL